MSRCIDLLPDAARDCTRALTRYADRDWTAVSAADLEWSCWATAHHIVDDLYFYAGQVIYGRSEGYFCTELAFDDSADPPRAIEALGIHAELLRRITATADPGTRAYHTYGVSDPEGFAAMGIVEALIHTYDMVRGMSADDSWRPSPELAAAVLDRLFPDAPAGDSVDVLLYSCGRTALGDRPRLHEWRWDGTVRA